MKILLIDDHALFRDGFFLLLEGLGLSVETFEASSYESAKNIMDQHGDLDLVLLDLGLPGVSHLDALTAIRRCMPKSKLVVLSGNENSKMIEDALNQGAKGYIPKSSPAKIMLNAMKLIISGGTYIPPEILVNIKHTAQDASFDDALVHRLTPRQYDVLSHLVDGASNKEIGTALKLTESTVRAHVAAILKEFNVKNRTQAVHHAIKMNWVNVESKHGGMDYSITE